MKQEGKRSAAIALVIIVAIALAAFWFLYEEKRLLEVSILDIGQGDSILIETPGGQVVLIDGGPDKKVLRRLSEELPFWEKRIDLMIVTHPHDDHFAGLKDVARRYRVDRLIITDAETKSANYREFREIVEQEEITLDILNAARRIQVDGAQLHFLYPAQSFKGEKVSDLNDTSIVTKLSFGEIDFLFTGDAEAPTEKELLSRLSHELESEVLKLGHHGSDTSSTEEFLKAVKPRLTVASAGVDNSYGHPSPRVIKRLERLGIPLRRTDLEGTIRFITDGQQLLTP